MKTGQNMKRIAAWLLAALMLLPVTAVHAEGESGGFSVGYAMPFIVSYPCAYCGETIHSNEQHNCQNFATITCGKCGDSYLDQPGYTHYCSSYCEKCGEKIPANTGHKCMSAWCGVCGQLYYGSYSNHDCPGGKVCDTCGEKYEAMTAHSCPQTQTCPKCGESYKASETHHCTAKMAQCEECGAYYDTAYKHTCTDERLMLCEACETVYWKSQGHDCPGGKTCILCGKLYHAKEGHVCGGSQKTLCGYCNVELKDGESHTRCRGCGKCFDGDIFKHEKECPARVPCEICGEDMVPNEYWHLCKITTCFKCGETYKLTEKHTCTMAKCALCEETYLKTEGHSCAYKLCSVCGEIYKRAEGHSCDKCTKCGEKIGEDAVHFCPYTRCVLCHEEYDGRKGHDCERILCLHCGNIAPEDEPCHSYCLFCEAWSEGSLEEHKKTCEHWAQAEECEYCGEIYTDDHLNCDYRPSSAKDGRVQVRIDYRSGEHYMRRTYMSGKLGEKYSVDYMPNMLEYAYRLDGKHYTYYEFDRIVDHNGGVYKDGMRKIDVWYTCKGRLTEEEMLRVTTKLPDAGNDVISPDGESIPPAGPEQEQQPEVPVVIPPEGTEEAEKATLIVMHADAVTGEPMWFMSYLSCPVGGSIELPAADIEGYAFKGYYDYDTGERYGSTYTARSADTVWLVAEYTNVGGPEAPAPTNTPAPATSPAAGAEAENFRRDMANEIVRLVNQERAKHGLHALQTASDTTEMAEARSKEIVTAFSHESAGGYLEQAYAAYWSGGENIAAGQSSAREFVDSWMQSPPHRANILNADFDYIGVGVYAHNGMLHGVQIFGGDRKQPAAAAPTAKPTATAAAKPAATPKPTATAKPTATPTPTPTAKPSPTPTPTPKYYQVTWFFYDEINQQQVGPIKKWLRVKEGDMISAVFPGLEGYTYLRTTFNGVPVSKTSHATITWDTTIIWYVQPDEETAAIQAGKFHTDRADALVELSNRSRAENGLPALRRSSVLDAAAMIRAREIVEAFSHTRPDGSDYFTVNEHYVYGENLARGGSDMTGAAAHAGLMGSASHKKNILNQKYGSVGVACFTFGTKCYYVQLFGL